MQYRFGKSGAVEASVPETTNTHPSKVTNGNNIMYSGGGGMFLRFKKGQYGYVVYGGEGKGWAKDGLAVEKSGKIISNLVCKGKVVSELDIRKLIETGIVAEDTENFDMP